MEINMYNNLLAKDKEWDAREAIVAMGKKLIANNLVAGTWGNISVRVNENKIAVTPSGLGYDNLKLQDIAILNNDGGVIEATHAPSTESKLHIAIYKAHPEAKAIIHTHSVYASALAAMHKDVPALVEDIVQICGGRVACAPYVMCGTQELADAAVQAMGERKAVLLANHGAVCWGKSLEDALIVAQVLEKAAQIATICNGQGIEISDADGKAMHQFYEEHYSKRQLGEE